MNIREFENRFTEYDRNGINAGFTENRHFAEVEGPAFFYRFVGFNEHDAENDPHGSWWFSKATFNDFEMKAKRLNVSFTHFAKVRLALPDNWNSKLHIFEWHIPAGHKLGCVKGVVKHQSIKGTTKERRDKNPDKHDDNVFFIGGDTQYYFLRDDVKKFAMQQIVRI